MKFAVDSCEATGLNIVVIKQIMFCDIKKYTSDTNVT